MRPSVNSIAYWGILTPLKVPEVTCPVNYEVTRLTSPTPSFMKSHPSISLKIQEYKTKVMPSELKWKQAFWGDWGPPTPPQLPGCSGSGEACSERGKQTQRRHPGLPAPHLTSTSRQLPGTKWIESSFSRPTMPAAFAPSPSRPQPPPAQHSRGPQRPRPWPASP